MNQITRILLGDNAYSLPDNFNNLEMCAECFQKAWPVIERDIDTLDTTESHRQVLCTASNNILTTAKQSSMASWELVYRLLFFISKLLGFGFNGKKHYELIVTQPDACFYQEKKDAGKYDPLDSHHDEMNVVSKRSELVKYLYTEKGESYRDIAKILNLTEHQVKQLKRKDFPRSVLSRDEIK